jgi:hypothetical protein
MATTASDPRRFVRTTSLTFALYSLVIMISSMAMVNSANAVGTVAPSAALWCSNPSFTSTCLYQTKEEACIALIGNRTDVYYGFLYYYPGGEAPGWTCWAYNATYPGNLTYAGRFGWIGSRAVCPANSTGTNTCTCNAGFEPDPTATSCVAENTCPANMSGSPCACNAGYEPDPSGTGCALAQYTLLVLQDPQPDVEPSASKEVIVRVENAKQEPQSGVRVKLKVDVNETSGGHAHGGADRDKGTLSGAACDPPEKNCATATTDISGYASFTFKAPAVSGEHTVTAACVSPACNNTDTGKINVKVDGLHEIPDNPLLYVLIGGEEDKKHHANHYLTDNAMSQLTVLAINYHYLYPNERVLHLNDASLVWGGLFDKDGDWDTPHKKHRRGVVIDIRANTASGNIPERLFTDFKKLAMDTKLADDMTSAQAKVHCSRGRDYSVDKCIGDDNRHFHVVLLGVEQ